MTDNNGLEYSIHVGTMSDYGTITIAKFESASEALTYAQWLSTRGDGVIVVHHANAAYGYLYRDGKPIGQLTEHGWKTIR